jgi:hypothetical protein
MRRSAAILTASLVLGLAPAAAASAAASPAPGHPSTTDVAAAAAPSDVVKVALAPDGAGGYLLRADGTVTAMGAATVLGPTPALAPGESAATLAATAHGYLVFSDRGRVFPSGDARAFGDLGGVPLNGPIVDAALTADGGGYWLLGSDGGVFGFGDARFAGSTGDLRLNSPAIGLVPDPDGDGYLFVAGDGGVFAFSAPFRGSMGGTRLNRPVVGMIPFGAGYLMVASDGGVFTFSDRPFLGSIGDQPALTASDPITSIAAGPAGDWYLLARRDGATFPFGPGTPAWARAVDPAAGNPAGTAAVPPEGRAVDTTHPDHVVGTGTPASCTSAAVVAAVALGGIITFDCGPDPVTIAMTATAKVRNDASPDVVIDGGGKVTLSGAGQRRILYMNTCDRAQVWTTSHCQDQDTPRLTVQDLTFADGNSTGDLTEGGGGGAIFVRGGRFKVIGSRFFRNVCDPTGPDLGGAAIRVLSQYHGLPVYVVGSTFGGAPGYGGSCSNGAALSSIGVSWEVLNSVFSHNDAIGTGANPARAGSPGGGSGGAIYLDGNTFTLHVAGTLIEDDTAREGGAAIFFVSNDRTGTLRIDDSTLRRNRSAGFGTPGFPGIFYLGSGPPQVSGSTIT